MSANGDAARRMTCGPGYGDADVSLYRLCGQPWTGQGFSDGKISFFRQHLALGRTGRYSRLTW